MFVSPKCGFYNPVELSEENFRQRAKCAKPLWVEQNALQIIWIHPQKLER